MYQGWSQNVQQFRRCKINQRFLRKRKTDLLSWQCFSLGHTQVYQVVRKCSIKAISAPHPHPTPPPKKRTADRWTHRHRTEVVLIHSLARKTCLKNTTVKICQLLPQLVCHVMTSLPQHSAPISKQTHEHNRVTHCDKRTKLPGDKEISHTNIAWRPRGYKFIVSDVCTLWRSGCLFFLTANSLFWPINNLKMHFTLQKPTST